MLLQELVERAAPDVAQGIVVMAGSEHLVPFLGPLAARVLDPSEASGPVVRIAAIGTSDVEDSVRASAEGLGGRDILVLAMRLPPGRLPVGRLVETLVTCGLWVVEGAPAPARGLGCALVVTRDDSAPWRSYLLGDTLARAERSVARLLAEHVVEGLALRAQGAELRSRDRARTLELEQVRSAMAERDAELEHARQEIADRAADRSVAQLRRQVDLQEAELRAVTEELRRAQRAEYDARHGGRVMRAIGLVRHDPVHGSSRVLRSVLRRRDRGHAHESTSENDDSSV